MVLRALLDPSCALGSHTSKRPEQIGSDGAGRSWRDADLSALTIAIRVRVSVSLSLSFFLLCLGGMMAAQAQVVPPRPILWLDHLLRGIGNGSTITL